MRRTKIVCTIGPSSSDDEIIRALIRTGMNVARMNFSHGDHAFHRDRFARLRDAAKATGSNLAILMDLQGPKIRTGALKNGETVTLEAGSAITITARPIEGDASRISTTYTQLPHDVQPGSRILLSDGTIELRVTEVSPPDILCTVVLGGRLGQHQGINLPGVAVSSPSLTEKDEADLALALELEADFVALSFVRKAEDVANVKRRIAAAGKDCGVVAKIERPEALQQLAGIIEEADALMVARGDLGVEVPLHNVPQIQKTIIRACNEQGVPVITATQMLESMVNNSRPTRAEAADVANAIYDGTDAVMLSAETATGWHPVRAVEVMHDIAAATDEAIASAPSRDSILRLRADNRRQGSFGNAIGQAVCRMAEVEHLSRIVCLTKSDFTARTIARYRPRTKITAISLSEEARRRCALIWGVDALDSIEVSDTDSMVEVVERLLLSADHVQAGDTIAIVAGTPLGHGGRTNMLRLHTIGNES